MHQQSLENSKKTKENKAKERGKGVKQQESQKNQGKGAKQQENQGKQSKTLVTFDLVRKS